MTDDQYQCAVCKRIFNKRRSDEEALAEMRAGPVAVPDEETDIVCDDCYNTIGRPNDPKSVQ